MKIRKNITNYKKCLNKILVVSTNLMNYIIRRVTMMYMVFIMGIVNLIHIKNVNNLMLY